MTSAMITVKPSTSEDEILSFIRGDGIKRKLGTGITVTEDPSDVVADPDNHFVVAYDNEHPVGFVAFFKMGDGEYGVHVVLKTIGIKTYSICEKAIKWAFEELKARSLFAIFPESHIAIRLLTSSFGFQNDPSLKERFGIRGQTEPFLYQRLDSIPS